MQFKILHYNVQLIFPLVVEQDNNYRAKLIAEYIGQFSKDVDVLSFCEAFDSESREILILYLYKFGFKYSTPVLNGDNNYFSNGGIFLISKIPIICHSFYVYRHSTGTDFLANKGIVKIKIKKDDTIIHIFSTHLQAWEEYSKTRAMQIKELHKYTKKWNFDEKDIVILSGDFNTSSLNLIQDLKYDFLLPRIVSYQKYTFDSSLNSMYGIDGSDPKFYERVKKSNGILSFSSKRQIHNFDHTLLMNNNRIPKKCFTEILVPKVATYHITLWKLWWFDSIDFITNDLSDHFPIVTTFEFDK